MRVAGELDCATAGLMGEALLLASEMPGDRWSSMSCGSRSWVWLVSGFCSWPTSALLRRAEAVSWYGGVGDRAQVFELTGFFGLLDDRDPQLRLSCSVGSRRWRRGSSWRVAMPGCRWRSCMSSYVALGGAADHGQLAGYLNGVGEVLDRHQRDIAVHAVNEHLGDVGRTDQLLSYASA